MQPSRFKSDLSLFKYKFEYSRIWRLETRDLETRPDRKRHFDEKIACLVKYVDSIGSALEPGNNTSIQVFKGTLMLGK
jgi:hypothetical protein